MIGRAHWNSGTRTCSCRDESGSAQEDSNLKTILGLASREWTDHFGLLTDMKSSFGVATGWNSSRIIVPLSCFEGRSSRLSTAATMRKMSSQLCRGHCCRKISYSFLLNLLYIFSLCLFPNNISRKYRSFVASIAENSRLSQYTTHSSSMFNWWNQKKIKFQNRCED